MIYLKEKQEHEKLYKKYNLSENEIDFIETMIKPKAGGITNGK